MRWMMLQYLWVMSQGTILLRKLEAAAGTSVLHKWLWTLRWGREGLSQPSPSLPLLTSIHTTPPYGVKDCARVSLSFLAYHSEGWGRGRRRETNGVVVRAGEQSSRMLRLLLSGEV